MPGIGGGPSIEHAEGGGVRGKHLLLGEEGVLPPTHGCSDVFVRLADLGEETFDLLIGADSEVGSEVLPCSAEAAAVGLVGTDGNAIGAFVLVTFAFQRGEQGATTGVGTTDAGSTHFEEEGLVAPDFGRDEL
jgi:hypothetical protein